jgi:hypothetical protein
LQREIILIYRITYVHPHKNFTGEMNDLEDFRSQFLTGFLHLTSVEDSKCNNSSEKNVKINEHNLIGTVPVYCLTAIILSHLRIANGSLKRYWLVYFGNGNIALY